MSVEAADSAAVEVAAFDRDRAVTSGQLRVSAITQPAISQAVAAPSLPGSK